MRVFCAWCLGEGKPDSEALIGEKEPPGLDSHGIRRLGEKVLPKFR